MGEILLWLPYPNAPHWKKNPPGKLHWTLEHPGHVLGLAPGTHLMGSALRPAGPDPLQPADRAWTPENRYCLARTEAFSKGLLGFCGQGSAVCSQGGISLTTSGPSEAEGAPWVCWPLLDKVKAQG